MNANSTNGHQRPQIIIRKRTRPRRVLPLPIVSTPEVLAEALFNLPQSHTWIFMKGKSLRD